MTAMESEMSDLQHLRSFTVDIASKGDKRRGSIARSRTVSVIFGRKDYLRNKAKFTFIWSGRMVAIMLRFIKIVLKSMNHSEDSQIKAVDELGSQPQNAECFGSMVFDVSYFKAKRDVDLTAEMKHILTLPSSQRNEEQLQTVLYGLQFLDSFSDLPTHVQEKLCKVAFYNAVPPKRLIIRQGHAALNFYFIISGRALVNVLSHNSQTGDTQVRTVAVLGKGDSFGEIALLSNKPRTASIVSQEHMQLLAIGREDFTDIYMVGSAGSLPPHILFLQSVDILNDFPVQILIDNPQHCTPAFYKRGRVIEQNNKLSQNLYIIMSGSCRVMKQLTISEANNIDTKHYKTHDGFTFDIKGIGNYHSKVNSHRRKTSSFLSPTVNQNKDLYLTEISESQTSLVAEVALASTRPTTHLPPITLQERKIKPSLEKTVLVEVAVLKSRDVFGLSAVIFKGKRDVGVEESAPVCLVSNGAECILINKDFFIRKATEKIRTKLQRHNRPYPDEKTFVDNYWVQMEWNNYKQKIYAESLSREKRS